jgi:hypothetical protein
VWAGFFWLRIENRAISFEDGNEPSGSTKGDEFFE